MPTEQQHAFSKVLDLVEEAGCIDHVVLIGSWAEFAYRAADVLPGFCPNIKTMDVDFLVRNLRRPSPAARLTALAKERGFFVESDRMTGTTKLLDITGLEVEFLIRKMGEGKEPALKTNIGVTAQALWHMDVILKKHHQRSLFEPRCNRSDTRGLYDSQDDNQQRTGQKGREGRPCRGKHASAARRRKAK